MFGCGCGSIFGSIFGSRKENSATREVIREVVVIPCKYCGTLFPQTTTACPHCGAKRTV
jgi:rubrerythrin